MQATKEKNILSNLSPEEQTKLSKKEAAKFDKERFDSDAELSEQEIQKIKDRKTNDKNYQEKTERDRLDTVLNFDSDPIGYLKEKLAAGNYEGRDRQHNYLLLVTLVRIEQALESFNLNKKSRK